MALDLDAIRGRLNKLQNTQKKSDLFWKPSPGKQQVRIVPYKYDESNPFIELLFHYGINNKTLISPLSFGRPDPIQEFADKLKSTGDKEDWKTGKGFEPKLRTYVPVIVRGKENEGVKFWGFGKTVYTDLLGYIADPDYGDIADIENGRDITVEYVTAAEGGTQYPTTNIRVKPAQTPLLPNLADAQKLIDNQVNITDLYTELSYEDLKAELEKWLTPEDEAGTQYKSSSPQNVASAPKAVVETPPQPSNPQKTVQSVPQPTQTSTPEPTSNVGAAFDELFN